VTTTPVLEVHDLAIASRRRRIGPFDLTVAPGETVGLVGPNGSGKTSCLRLALGLDRADRGSTRIHGRTVTPWRPPTGVGVVLEADGCYPWSSGRENLELFAVAVGDDGPDVVDDALAAVGLTPAADRPVRQYSRGMRQRLAFARAALGQPSLFVLDEPTVALDDDAAGWLVELLVAHHRGGGSVVVASHDRAFLDALAARRVTIDQGRTR
jgi:ABC-2 type transport system ATP-binding protein